MRNLEAIKEHGLAQFIGQQRKRIRLLERMIAGFDDGRSKSFFCRAACRHDLASLESALHEALQKIKTGQIKPDDAKGRAKILREILT
jgi:hypothetical protein